MDNASCINWQNCTANPPSGSDKLVGWIPESPGRGTLSLLSTSLLALFLCTWVVIHPRIDRRQSFRILHKLVLFLKTILAPELIAVEGAQEWTQARKMIRICEELTRGDFELIHAFYIGMLGVRYRTPNGTKVLWPNQFVWLLQERLLDWDNHVHWGLARENILDRSNADETAKLLALGQVGWFVAQSVLRTVKKLPLAPFESMTLSYIPLFALTCFFWWRKPKDIETPSEIILPPMNEDQIQIFESMSLHDDFDEEGTRQQNSYWIIWYLTPRMFEKAEVQNKLDQTVELQDIKEEGQSPTGSFEQVNSADEIVLGHWDPDLYHSRLLWPVTCLFGVSFRALHLISWNGTFPTVFEMWLWRGTAITSIVTMLIFMQHEKVVVRRRNPLTYLKVVAPLLYLLSRAVMIAEALIAFRASDPAIYETFIVWNTW